MNLIKAIVKEIRVNHWIKNILIFSPLFFSRQLLHFEFYPSLALWFIAFSVIASAVYVINDLFDVEKDRKHPKKKFRPIASWTISKTMAYIMIWVLTITWFSIAFFTNIWFFALLLAYFISNLIYSINVKHIAVLDILFISIMYFMRVLGWALIIDVKISSYIFITIFFWAMFLISAKRYAELIWDSTEKRKVLEFYNEKVLESIFLLSMAVALVSYIMYTVSQGWIYFYSIVFVVYVFIKYVYLVFWEWKGEEPEMILVKDKATFVSIMLWLVFSMYFYYNEQIHLILKNNLL